MGKNKNGTKGKDIKPSRKGCQVWFFRSLGSHLEEKELKGGFSVGQESSRPDDGEFIAGQNKGHRKSQRIRSQLENRKSKKKENKLNFKKVKERGRWRGNEKYVVQSRKTQRSSWIQCGEDDKSSIEKEEGWIDGFKKLYRELKGGNCDKPYPYKKIK